MNRKETAETALQAKNRVAKGLDALRVGLSAYVSRRMSNRYGRQWRHYASRAGGGDRTGELDLYALLKTLLALWRDLFSDDAKLRKARSYISLSMDARNSIAHFTGRMSAREAIRYLDAMRELALAVGAGAQVKLIGALYDEQLTAQGGDQPRATRQLPLGEPPAPARLRPWRDVCEPHPDVLSARFSDAEFAANLALVDQGEGSEEYVDPAAFFRITYATEGITRVLTTTVARMAGKGGDPVIGLQTNFGGGKTHTMLALHHLAGAAEAGYEAQRLAGMASIFKAADVGTLGHVRRAVFVGTHKGAAEVMHVENGREIRTLWGYLAWRLGGWEAVDHIADSEAARTNPGSERLIPILRRAAPCIVLMDEVVAFARQLRGLEYDAFHAFIQSLTEAGAAVDGAVVVGSLPESGAEVGDEQGRDALRRLEKIFGRVQSAWMPASGIETFEIVRRRLFQPLDPAEKRIRNQTIRAFRKFYRENPADFPPEVREPAYEEEMRRAYPLHPEILRRFSGDWSVLEKFQRTRGILKIMADVVYTLWRGESRTPLITPAMLPFRDVKVRTALLEPLDPAFGPILQSEVDGDQSHTARIEARRPRFLRTRAATRAARAVFFATAPHAGARRGGVTGSELRLACAQPGDQIAIFKEALEELASRSAHLYRDGNSYWFSPKATLNKIAADRARDVSDGAADRRITQILREEQRSRAGFSRVHAAPDNLTDIEDRRATALVILPPSASHDPSAGSRSPAEVAAREALERRGSGQRKYRNALVFVAPDATNIDAARQNAKRERAWQSILNDVDLRDNLTRAQTSDAETQARRSGEALLRSIRSAWVHVLHPAPPEGAGDASTVGGGYAMHSARLINRGGAKGVPKAVWDKAVGDGTVIEKMGPQNLAQSLEPVWPDDQTHIPIETIRDWFASYVYMPRLRDRATFDKALERLVSDLGEPYAYASAFNEDAGRYEGAIEGIVRDSGDLRSGLLVLREAVQPYGDEGTELDGTEGSDLDETDDPVPDGPPAEPSPRRFFASISVDPERAGLEVARIMDGLLVELTRSPGSNVRVTLEIEGTADEPGYPEDVVDIAKANARDLKLDEGAFGFER
ncbi:MAG: DUF499 domain-containing protein [Gemmatimonadetes bacterium]|nr:DUF499 domain-containing protein [Candidatus Palauibacter rhopaloidicola]